MVQMALLLACLHKGWDTRGSARVRMIADRRRQKVQAALRQQGDK